MGVFVVNGQKTSMSLSREKVNIETKEAMITSRAIYNLNPLQLPLPPFTLHLELLLLYLLLVF